MYPASPVPPATQMPPAAAANSYLYSNAYHSQYNYGYPVGIEIYPSQTMQYMGYHQPAMTYGGYGGPGQGAVPVKKKFYGNGTNYKKEQAGGGAGGGAGGAEGRPVQVTIKNLFKFELGNSNCVRVDGLKIEYPMYVNTTPEEFAQAKLKRHMLRLEALRELDGRKAPVAREEKDKRAASEQKQRDAPAPGGAHGATNAVENEKVEKRDTRKEEPHARKEAEVPQATPREPKEADVDTTSQKVFTSPRREDQKPSVASQKKRDDVPAPANTPLKSEEKKGEPSGRTMKSWSQVASNAASKKPIPANVSLAAKKEKRYIPSSIKGSEPLGTVALRMCLDKDYINYVSSTMPESAKAIKLGIPRGIMNKGNICFMSSVLQVLLFCEPFIEMLNVVHARTGVKSWTLLPPLLGSCLEFYKEFEKLHADKDKNDKQSNGNGKSAKANRSSQPDAIDPEHFYKCISKLPMFKDLQWGHQEDAEEFLTHFLDQLHEEFVSSINSLSCSDMIHLLQSLSDDDLKAEFVRSLSKYKRAEFIKNMSSELKALIDKYGSALEYDTSEGSENSSEWHEVSKKGKKTRNTVKRTTELEPSPIMSIFGGEYRSVLDIPQNKESHSITLDPFYTLHLHISDPEVNDLESAFKKFSDFEYLSYKADSGNDVEAKKQAFLDRLPRVLLIQLKRFEFVNNSSERRELINYNAYNGRIEKIRKWIRYDQELTIPKEALSSVNAKFYLSGKDTTYRLTGVVYHHGLSPSGGHYTADVLHQTQDKWYRIDDNNVTEIRQEDVFKRGDEASDSKTAYILIYQR